LYVFDIFVILTNKTNKDALSAPAYLPPAERHLGKALNLYKKGGKNGK